MARQSTKSNVIRFDKGNLSSKGYRSSSNDDISGLEKIIKAEGHTLTDKQKVKLARFQKDFKKLKRQAGVGNNDFKSDALTRSMYRAMMGMGLELVPIAQQKYMDTKSESAMYALMSLINQLKDVSNEIRNMQDLEEQSEHIVKRILMPSFVLATQNLLSTAMALKAELDSAKMGSISRRKIKASIDDMLKGQAQYMNELSRSVNDSTTKYLLGDE